MKHLKSWRTDMTREQVKELLPIIQAYTKGKVIEQRCAESWVEVDEDCDFHFPANSYRIKPEPKYCPFKDAEECWAEMQKHQPFGWVKDGDGSKFTIGTMASSDGSIFVSDEGAFYLGEMFEKFKFADGTPFGIKEEE